MDQAGRINNGDAKGLTTAERDELRELPRKVKRLTVEREIQKERRPSRERERDPVAIFRFIAAEKANYPVK